MKLELSPLVWSWLVAIAAAAYAYFGLFQQVIPTFGKRGAGGGADEPAPSLEVRGPAARWYGIGFALVIPLAFANHVLGMLGLGALLVVAWFQAK